MDSRSRYLRSLASPLFSLLGARRLPTDLVARRQDRRPTGGHRGRALVRAGTRQPLLRRRRPDVLDAMVFSDGLRLADLQIARSRQRPCNDMSVGDCRRSGISHPLLLCFCLVGRRVLACTPPGTLQTPISGRGCCRDRCRGAAVVPPIAEQPEPLARDRLLAEWPSFVHPSPERSAPARLEPACRPGSMGRVSLDGPPVGRAVGSTSLGGVAPRNPADLLATAAIALALGARGLLRTPRIRPAARHHGFADRSLCARRTSGRHAARGFCAQHASCPPAPPASGLHCAHLARSEERRVGKECGSRWCPYQYDETDR